jgi:hypothetical protein
LYAEGARWDEPSQPPVSLGGLTGSAGRYLAGLCVAALGLCAGGWLVLTPFAFGYPGRGRAAVTALATGGGLVLVCLSALACWTSLWRRKLRADGVLPPRQSRRSRRSERRQARAERLVRAARQRELVAAPDPAQVLTDLRALLTPLLTESGVELVPAPNGATSGGGPAGPSGGPDPGGPSGGHDLDSPSGWYDADGPSGDHLSGGTDVTGAADPASGNGTSEVSEMAEGGGGPAEVVAVSEGGRQVQAPGQLRGTRSASFLIGPRSAATPDSAATPVSLGTAELLQGAELLMVGTGEEEAW